MDVLVIVLVIVFINLICAFVAESLDKEDPDRGFMFGLFLGIFGIIIAAILSTRQKPSQTTIHQHNSEQEPPTITKPIELNILTSPPQTEKKVVLPVIELPHEKLAREAREQMEREKQIAWEQHCQEMDRERRERQRKEDEIYKKLAQEEKEYQDRQEEIKAKLLKEQHDRQQERIAQLKEWTRIALIFLASTLVPLLCIIAIIRAWR